MDIARVASCGMGARCGPQCENGALTDGGTKVEEVKGDKKAKPKGTLLEHKKLGEELAKKGKGVKDFDETDAYVTGCVARACGAAIAWVLGNMQNARCSEFASAVLTTNSLKEFTQHSCRAMERLFNCDPGALPTPLRCALWHRCFRIH